MSRRGTEAAPCRGVQSKPELAGPVLHAGGKNTAKQKRLGGVRQLSRQVVWLAIAGGCPDAEQPYPPATGSRVASTGRLGTAGSVCSFREACRPERLRPGYTAGPCLIELQDVSAKPARVRHARRSFRRVPVAVVAHSIRSTATAVPPPVPWQIAASPSVPSCWRSACTSVTMMRAPEQPIGWPSAMAPPCTFSFS